MKHAFLVQTLGYWARGKTVLEAAEQIRKLGAERTRIVIIDICIGDDTPEIINGGMNIAMEEGSNLIRVANGLTLGQLLSKLKD